MVTVVCDLDIKTKLQNILENLQPFVVIRILSDDLLIQVYSSPSSYDRQIQNKKNNSSHIFVLKQFSNATSLNFPL